MAGLLTTTLAALNKTNKGKDDETRELEFMLPAIPATFIYTNTHTYSLPRTHTPLYVTSPLRADLNFLTYLTGEGGPSIFKWSALSMRSTDWNV